jgi:Carboxypeptidase regulatory-like domain
MTIKWHLAAVLCTLVAVGSLAAPSPPGLGTVGGQVLDVGGKPVAHAHVTLQASEGNQLQITETNNQGHFWFAFLPEGQYSVRASIQGRVSEWREGIWVSPGRQTDVILHLRRQQKSSSRSRS